MKSHGRILTASFVTVALCAVVPSHAATIAWSVFNISPTGNVSDISTTGTVHYTATGSDLGTADVVDGSSIIVNGVRFFDNLTSDTPTHRDTIGTRGGVPSIANAPGDTGNYFGLLNNGDRNSSGLSTITLSSLTIGTQYQIQIWHSDNNAGTFADNGMVLNAGGTTNPDPNTSGHATLIRETTDGGRGQFALGTFVADSTTQQFQARGYTGLAPGGAAPSASPNLTINAYQVRAIPEPSTAILGAFGAIAMLRRRR